MTETHCPSCGYRIATPAVPARCPRCGDPLTAPDADTVTHVPQPEAALPPTVSPGDATAAREPGPAAPSSRFPSVPGYELLEVIGRGGMGVVYKARQLSPRRIVALKMIPGGRAERFSTEVAAVARLQHPNVVHIHEVGAVAGRPFFSMEYVPGGTLATHMRGKPLPPRAAAELVAQLARGVQHAHERGVVHRDLKPANILLGAELGARSAELKAGEENGGDSFDSAFRVPRSALLPKIADFGLAKYLDGSADGSGPQTQSGAILGTPNYMAPEQARGKTRDVGPGADVYALGAILYECLTGRPPFREESPVDTLMKVVSDDPKPPRKICRAVPRDLEVICMKCLRKNPRERYTAGELADDLERFLDGQPILARPRTAREQLAGWARRRRGFLLVAAGAALVAVVALAFADRSPRRPAFPAPGLVPRSPGRVRLRHRARRRSVAEPGGPGTVRPPEPRPGRDARFARQGDRTPDVDPPEQHRAGHVRVTR
jgi:serine/threonine protein kinase